MLDRGKIEGRDALIQTKRGYERRQSFRIFQLPGRWPPKMPTRLPEFGRAFANLAEFTVV